MAKPAHTDNELFRIFCYTSQELTFSDLREFLEYHPDVDLSHADKDGDTILHQVCRDNNPAIVSFLVKQPGVNINAVNRWSETPLFAACEKGRHACVQEMILCPGLDVNTTTTEGYTALSFAVHQHDCTMAELILSSNEDVCLAQLPFNSNAAGMTKNHHVRERPQYLDLFKRYENNPVALRCGLRLKDGHPEDLAAGLLASVVLLCDRLLRFHNYFSRDDEDMARFLVIAKKLPLELQMILCRRSQGLPGDFISSKLLERYLRYLVAWFPEKKEDAP